MKEPESQVSYELLILTRGRWQTYNVYPGDKEVIAMADAHSMEKVSTITGVQLIKESYDSKTGKSRQWTMYEAGVSNDDNQKAVRKRPAESDSSLRIGYSERTSVVRAPDAGSARREQRADGKSPGVRKGTNGEARGKGAPRSFLSSIIRILMALVISVSAAMVVMHLVSGLIEPMGDIPYFKKDDLLIILFILTFALVSGGLLWRILMSGRASTVRHRDTYMSIEPAKPSRWKRRRKVYSSRLGRFGFYDPDKDEFDFGPGEGTDSDATDQKKAEADSEENKEEENASAASEMDEFDPHYSPALDSPTRALDDFVEHALKDVRGAIGQTDAYGLFGMALFLVGASEGLKRAEALDDETHGRLTVRALYSFGMKKDRITQFAGRYEDYLVADPRYMRMFQAGRNAMTDYVESGPEEAGAASALAAALVEWNTPRTKAETTAPTAIVFTDIAGSTAMTQNIGDSAAQKIIRQHNRIVREAVTANGGREVKHTGDGIMASFPNVTGGVTAAIEMMQRVLRDNASDPETPLHLKIGINAGEPIAEDDDLFGSSVQLAARLVDKAQPDRIFVSEAVRLLCSGKGIRFVRIGSSTLKGFAEPVTVFEVIWDESLKPLNDAADVPADDEEAVQEKAPADATEAEPEEAFETPPSEEPAVQKASSATDAAVGNASDEPGPASQSSPAEDTEGKQAKPETPEAQPAGDGADAKAAEKTPPQLVDKADPPA